MRLSKTNEAEIMEFLELLIDLDNFKKEWNRNDFSAIEWDEFKIIKKFNRDTWQGFLNDLLRAIEQSGYIRILYNCDTLLKNCADASLGYLDFKPEIKAGLELLEKQTPNHETH